MIGDSFSERIVRALAEKYLNSGRNITMGNYFTSFALANALERKATLFGTVRQSRRALPPKAKSIQGVRKGDSMHIYKDIASDLFSEIALGLNHCRVAYCAIALRRTGAIKYFTKQVQWFWQGDVIRMRFTFL